MATIGVVAGTVQASWVRGVARESTAVRGRFRRGSLGRTVSAPAITPLINTKGEENFSRDDVRYHEVDMRRALARDRSRQAGRNLRRKERANARKAGRIERARYSSQRDRDKWRYSRQYFRRPIAPKCGYHYKLTLQSLCVMLTEGDREHISVGFNFYKTDSLE
jgi:hypothetical protein